MTTTATSTAPQEIQLVRLMQDLVNVMEREIVVLEERLNAELPDLVSRKQRLLIDYQAEFKTAIQHPEWLKQLPAAQKTLLQRLGEKMRDVSERNARTVKATLSGTQRLLHGIMASVRDDKCKQQGYEHLVQTNGMPSTKSVLFKTTA